MDIDRRREEAKDKNRKPRLIEEDEIPISIIDQSNRFTEDEERNNNKDTAAEPFTDMGRRKRKDVNYSQVYL